MLLSDYLSQTQDLIHDPQAQVWSLAQVTNYINEARRRIAVDSKCLRQVMTPAQFPSLQFSAGFEFFNPQTFLPTPQGPQLVDTINIVVIINSARSTLRQIPYTTLTTQMRPWANYQSYPRFWSKVSPTQYVIAPVPSMTYQCEFDVAVGPSVALGNPTDDDPDIPVPYQDIVQYFAAYKAKINQQQLQEATAFLGLYRSELVRVTAAYWGRINPNPAGDR